MYIPRALFASTYAHLKANAHPTASSVLILCALDTDSLCAARILVSLLKRDYIVHQIKPVSGFIDLENVNEKLVKGNEDLKFIISLGLGAMSPMGDLLDLSRGPGQEEIELWIIDGKRPWNLYNVYAGGKEGDTDVAVATRAGKVAGGQHNVGNGVGGIKCFDDGDIAEDMMQEMEAFKTLIDMPVVDDSDDDDDDDDNEDVQEPTDPVVGSDDVEGRLNPRDIMVSPRKRKVSDELDSEDEYDVGRQRRRLKDSNTVFCFCPLDTSPRAAANVDSPLAHLPLYYIHTPSSRIHLHEP